MMRRFVCLAVLLATTSAAWAQTPETLRAAVASPSRSPAFVARDAARHPLEELAFFGVQPTSSVVEIWPGGGYWTEILAPYLHDRGHYIAAVPPGDGTTAFHARFPQARTSTLGGGQYEVAPPGSVDFVLTFRNLHNWMAKDEADRVLAGFFAALKPGGGFGIEEHRARPDRPQDPHAASGYVRQDYAMALAHKAGFVFVAASEIDANPRDTTDWPKGVWTLPPEFRLGDLDRAKYAAIGEADNFVLLFRKP